MGFHESDLTPEAVSGNSATYCPEDNKLRIYCGRLERDSYLHLCRHLKFTSTPKQECAFVAVWSPAAEDACRALIPEWDQIGDEDYSPQERSADRADRFAAYRDKRAAEAHRGADRWESGPNVFGNQNPARAERSAARHDRLRDRAVSQWEKATYWQSRTVAVIEHAQHKNSAALRRGRILKIEAGQRRNTEAIEGSVKAFAAWKAVLDLPGGDMLAAECLDDSGFAVDVMKASQAILGAFRASSGEGTTRVSARHPDEPSGERHSSHSLLTGAYSLVTRTKLRQLSAHEVARLVVGDRTEALSADCGLCRCARHYELRLAYENQMLENEGGKAADVEMVAGGWLGSRQIQRVNKSAVTKRVVSVEVIGQMYEYQNGAQNLVTGPVRINVERFGTDVYRAPTDQELKAFKAARKAAKPEPVPTINPTDEDAQKFQNLLNDRAIAKKPDVARVEVRRMTQKQFSDCLKRESTFIREIDQVGNEGRKFCLRMARGGGFFNYQMAMQVIILTDKPQKSIPIDWVAAADASEKILQNA